MLTQKQADFLQKITDRALSAKYTLGNLQARGESNEGYVAHAETTDTVVAEAIELFTEAPKGAKL